jgi:acyl-CoA dehydrogenase
MDGWFWPVVTLAVVWALAYRGAPLASWTKGVVALLVAWGIFSDASFAGFVLVGGLTAAVLVALHAPGVRGRWMTRVFEQFRAVLPQVSQTEQEALDAGTVWWDGDLFSGAPDWNKLLAYPAPGLTAEEQAFVDGPVEELCRMIDDWRITHELNDLPADVWRYIRDQGFFGLIIPREYGGKGFSAQAHSEVVMKITSRSGTAAVTVMVPNSLGPAELLLHYGTDAQKQHYLPRLARGEEIPCFALTGPEAGSDAGSIPDFGIVCRGEFDGRPDVLGIRVTWEKRYITLGPVATVLGLAFRLYDPDQLLGTKEDIGITLALIPTSTPGVNIGRRHYPLNAAFQNGPNSGRDVFIPMDWVIGGAERAGQGWRMLMNCLSVGRSISLPANGVGVAKLAARTCGAYGRVRMQFKTPIGRFEGVEEALARIGGNAYIMDAARKLTALAVDLGEKPSVLSAIIKHHLTERSRQVINDAMDVHGGKGICMGPSNYLARAYQQTPIGITVEGANILTRSMMIFGQGAIRCHPYVLAEIAATREADREQAIGKFDAALSGHFRYALANAARALFLGITGARFVNVPGSPAAVPWFRQLSRMAAAFALTADLAMLILGGSLKRREKISARLGDILSQIYLASAALKRYEDEGRNAADRPLLDWSVQDALWRIQEAFAGVIDNFPNRPVAWLLRLLVFPLGRPYGPPSDRLGHQVADLLLLPSAARDRLTAGMYLPRDEAEAVGRVEAAMRLAIEAEGVEAKIRAAIKDGQITVRDTGEQIDRALALGIVAPGEAELLARLKAIRRAVIMVDDFPPSTTMRPAAAQ